MIGVHLRRILIGLMAVVGAVALSPIDAALAQDVAFTPERPRFLYRSEAGATPIEVDASRTAVLSRVISLRIDRPTIGRLLTAIEAQTGLTFAYDNDFPEDRPITFRADSITVAAALSGILLDTGVDVLLSRRGHAALVPRSEPKASSQEPGTIIGRVTEVESGNAIVNAQVAVDGRGRSFTNDDGRYRVDGVTPGRRTISVKSIGFRDASQEIEVGDGATVTVDFALDVSPTTLNELVVTATGQQRRVELGHVVGRIDADSVVREAPISTISELLTGRVAGVQVFQDQGTVGGAVRLKVRGPNSLAQANEPIVIVDGVRYTASQIPTVGGAGLVLPERTSPLNDLNPNDIESIEVVKGPSAATLYGTDAANGVILITTKRGRGGPARWNAYARAARTSIPTFRYPDAYVGYGTTASGEMSTFCSLANVAAGSCTIQDSIVVVPNPLNDPELTIFGNQPMWETGLSVSGGSGDVTYYLSGSYQDATGPVQMPRAAVELLEANRGERIPDEWRKPNLRTNLNLRANVAARLGTADLAVQAGYVRDATQSLSSSNPFSVGAGIVAGNPATPYGFYPPEEVFAGQSAERTDRFVGSATAQWRPVPWLLTRAAVGLDIGARNRYSLIRRGDASTALFGLYSTGAVTDQRARQLTSTGDLMASAIARRGRLSFKTSVGAQYVRSLTDVLASGGTDLPPGGSSVAEAGSKTADQNYGETVTLGGYVEEMVGLNDRLFLTGALRVDGASTFGQGYDAAAYPKVGASWLASEEPFFPRVPGFDELRLRYAFGVSGLQPKPEWARPGYAATSVFVGWVNDHPQTVLELTSLGNPDLRPERVREHEFGFDVAGLDGRAQLGITWFRRRTIDQIVRVPVAPGYGSVLTNLGLTKQRGFEAELTAHLVNTRRFTWDVTATHSVHRTKLLDAGDAAGFGQARGPSGGTFLAGFVEGYSLSARFMPEVTFEDLNGDGIIGLDELQWSPPSERVYAGETEPPISQALATVLAFFDRRVRVSALLERRADFVQEDRLKTSLCNQSLRCPALVDPATPLAEQADALATREAFNQFVFLEPGDYIRLRELTLALDLPLALVRGFGGRSAAVSLSGRNVALWTDFSGPDVESGAVSSVGGIPQGRTWTVRFDVEF